MQFFTQLGNFFAKFFRKGVQEQLEIILPIARQVVVQISKDPSLLASDDKRNAAIGLILAELTAKEIIFAQRLVNLAIEIAVVEFKGIN